MRTRLTAFAVAALLAAGTLAAAQEAPRFVVRDSDGAAVAWLASRTTGSSPLADFAEGPQWVALRVPGAWVWLPMSQDTLWATRGQVPFLFENEDCSGPALLESPQNQAEARVALVFDTWVYWPASRGTSHIIQAVGVPMTEASQCEGTYLESRVCCTLLEKEREGFAARARGFYVADLLLRPPFRLEQAAVPEQVAQSSPTSPRN